jgi:beta-aspartyl-peptidase (threonine type)
MAIHGGAGALSKGRYSAEEVAAFKKGLDEALENGFQVLRRGGSAVDAVTQAVVSLENCPLFNAGRGSVLCADGRVQMDAAVMCGHTGRCGGVSVVETLKNPVLGARLVMEKTAHRLLAGKDADAFGKAMGLETQALDYFLVPRRQEQLVSARKHNSIQLDHDEDDDDSHTVGAVAMDESGHLAAATSTGGMTNKLPGRVSDSSVIGAGTFAEDSTLAFSATGTGDVFIQNVSGFDAHALMSYGKFSLKEACKKVLEKVHARGGYGGVIAISREGEIFMGFNSGGMFRASLDETGRKEIELF